MAGGKRGGKAPPSKAIPGKVDPGKAAPGKAAPGKVLPELRRYPGTLRAIGAVLPAVTRTAFRKEGALLGQLLADWPSVVGPAIAAAADPRRLAAGTLTLGCTGPVAMELQHLAAQLAERVNLHLGRPAVQRLRFVQEAPRPRPSAAVPPPKRAAVAPVKVDGLPDGPLRDALAALGGALRAAEDPERA